MKLSSVVVGAVRGIAGAALVSAAAATGAGCGGATPRTAQPTAMPASIAAPVVLASAPGGNVNGAPEPAAAPVPDALQVDQFDGEIMPGCGRG